MPLKSYIFGRRKGKENTFIGGVSATIGTAALLATKLGIAVSRISLFSVNGSDIQCRISGTYDMPTNAFGGVVSTNNNPGITFYRDTQNLCISLGTGSFYSNQQQMLITDINFGGVISVGDFCFFGGGQRNFIRQIILPNATALNGTQIIATLPDLERVVIPRCTILGATVGNNNIFQNSKLTGTIIYANPFLQTNNAGGVDGDLAAAISGGAIVRYVTNFTAPNPITTLAAGQIFNTAIQLNFTAPTGNTNAIDFYEVYINGVFNRNITASGQYVTGLTPNTSYSFTVIAVDFFYNKSVVSNNVIVSTNSASSVATSGLVSYYRLDETTGTSATDSFGANNGTNTAVTLGVAGKIGNAYSFNGTSSFVNLGNAISLQLTTGAISVWIKTSGAGSSYRGMVVKQLAYSLFLNNNVLVMFDWTAGVERSTGINLADNTWHHIVLNLGVGANNTTVFVDGVLRLTTTITVLNQTNEVRIGRGNAVNNSQDYLGQIDETAFYNRNLITAEIALLYNNGNGTTL